MGSLKINSSTNRDTSEGPETSVLEVSTRRIRFCLHSLFLFGRYFESNFEKEVKMDYTKIEQVHLDFPRRELFEGLGFTVALSGFLRNLFFVCVY